MTLFWVLLHKHCPLQILFSIITLCTDCYFLSIFQIKKLSLKMLCNLSKVTQLRSIRSSICYTASLKSQAFVKSKKVSNMYPEEQFLHSLVLEIEGDWKAERCGVSCSSLFCPVISPSLSCINAIRRKTYASLLRRGSSQCVNEDEFHC